MCIYVCIGFCLIFFHWTLWCKISINNVITTNGVWHSYVPSDKSNDISQVISKHTIIWSDLDLNVVWAFQISVCFSNWLWFMTLLSVSYLDFSLENIHINPDCPSDWPWYECVCRSDIFAVHYHYSLGCPGRGGAGRHSCIVKYALLSWDASQPLGQGWGFGSRSLSWKLLVLSQNIFSCFNFCLINP